MTLALYIAAFVLFILSFFGAGGKFDLVAGGLACLALTLILPLI